MNAIKIRRKGFSELTTEELYQILRLRSEVFVVEQDCVYQDIDNQDQKAHHVLMNLKDELIAYARIFPPEVYFKEASIGRVLVKDNFRGKGLAHDLMSYAIQKVLQLWKPEQIKISAQTYLIEFYQQHEFRTTGDEYLEDGILHINMIR